jgi:hypothetical protein
LFCHGIKYGSLDVAALNFLETQKALPEANPMSESHLAIFVASSLVPFVNNSVVAAVSRNKIDVVVAERDCYFFPGIP